MPDLQEGSRLIVRIPFGFREVVVQWYEMRDGRLWLHGLAERRYSPRLSTRPLIAKGGRALRLAAQAA